ncbi:type II toxin-antitoxin system prevent-host-death family antitoxin [Streptomyces sp. NPDC005574]|uniref:type II toxin-antitoxin system prevent-host-death family antitoxin n=1 Tax=Streptomyces sp. NPDC005574 TaxID=3156891 RepID=UPI00339FAC15
MPKSASDARRDLYGLVKSAVDDGITTLIHKSGNKRVERVLLAPLDRFPAARKAGAFPTWTLSAAQKDFGTLISRAASGEPQVLRRNSTPVAVLIPADPNEIALSPDMAAPEGAATAGGAVTSQPTPTRERGRRLATLGDAIGAVLATGTAPGLSFGLARLDEATGGLHPGRLILVAAQPQVGGSLIGLAAARAALARSARVLYAASGPSSADITRRIIAAEAGGDYARLKTGALTDDEQRVVERLRHAPLLIDDGSDLTAEAIADTAADMAPLDGGLALVVVDRLQRARNPRLPLSGEHLPEASQVLRELARSQNVPVLAVVDTDDPAVVNLLDADVILTFTNTPGQPTTSVTVAERDLGIIATTSLRPDLAHARFLDTTPRPTPVGSAPASTTGTSAAAEELPDSVDLGTVADRELGDAALPFTSGAVKGLPAEATRLLAALRSALAGGHVKDLDDLHAPLRELAATGLQTPDSPEGRRLAAALHAYNTPTPTPAAAPVPADMVDAPVGEAGEGVRRDDDDGLVPGDEEDEPEGAVFPALRILKEAVGRSKMHPIPVIRTEEREAGPWPLISEDMDGEPGWVHPDVTSTRVAHERNGKRVRRDQLDMPASFGDGLMCLIDRNGSFPSACSAVPLAPNKLLHTGPLDVFDKSQAGIYQIDVPAWEFAGMPHPLGRLADRSDEQGRVWVTTPHVKMLERLHRDGHLTDPVTIHDSWTGKANESLFKPFYQATKEARTELIQAGGEPYKKYKTRLSIALRLLWPKRPESRSPFWRPDWRMSMVAEASVRHWFSAFKAVQAGHTLIALRNVDAAIFWVPDQTAPDTYRVGTGFGEVKAKFIQPGTFIPEGDD